MNKSKTDTKSIVFRYLKHAFITIVVIVSTLIIIGINIGARANYGTHEARLNWNNEGPYIFYESDSVLSINYIQGDKQKGFSVKRTITSLPKLPIIPCFNPFDSSQFDFELNTNIEVPPTTYNDGEPIFAVSDIEGNYMTFRNFLINSNVIDRDLAWNFGKGHLVLVGDFVDRGFYVTQTLWLIYKLEQEAKKAGGKVHYIIGNHELKNLQANYESASPKYFHLGAMLGKQQQELYDDKSFIGRWLSSKNSVELINGVLFAHGGLHPDIQRHDLTLNELNEIIRKNYRTPSFPKPNPGLEELLTSSRTGPCWYRGYFKDDVLTELEVEAGLKQFNAKAVVVGHTIQGKVSMSFNRKVIGIDVRHPSDDEKNWPAGSSEGLLIEDGLYYRILEDGERREL